VFWRSDLLSGMIMPLVSNVYEVMCSGIFSIIFDRMDIVTVVRGTTCVIPIGHLCLLSEVARGAISTRQRLPLLRNFFRNHGTFLI
jgi:hypothetical protein